MHEANLEGAILVNREKTLVISKRSENMFNAIHFGAIIRIIARKHYLCFAPLVFCRTYRTANSPNRDANSLSLKGSFQIGLTPICSGKPHKTLDGSPSFSVVPHHPGQRFARRRHRLGRHYLHRNPNKGRPRQQTAQKFTAKPGERDLVSATINSRTKAPVPAPNTSAELNIAVKIGFFMFPP